MATSAPSRANSTATARPMPKSPPVISATLPSSFPSPCRRARHTSAPDRACVPRRAWRGAAWETAAPDIREPRAARGRLFFSRLPGGLSGRRYAGSCSAARRCLGVARLGIARLGVAAFDAALAGGALAGAGLAGAGLAGAGFGGHSFSARASSLKRAKRRKVVAGRMPGGRQRLGRSGRLCRIPRFDPGAAENGEQRIPT